MAYTVHDFGVNRNTIKQEKNITLILVESF